MYSTLRQLEEYISGAPASDTFITDLTDVWHIALVGFVNIILSLIFSDHYKKNHPVIREVKKLSSCWSGKKHIFLSN